MGDSAQFLDSRIPALEEIASAPDTSNGLRGAIAFGMPIARVGTSVASGALGMGQLATSQVVRNRAGENLTEFLMEHPVETTQKALKDWRAKPWNEQVSDLLVAGGSSLVGGGIAGKLKALDYSPHISMGPVRNRFGQTGAANINFKRNPKWKANKTKDEPVATESASAEQTYERHPQTGHPINAKIEYRPNTDHILDGSRLTVEGDPVITHYYENPGHHDPDKRPGVGNRDYNSEKSVLPDNHVELFKSSVPYIKVLTSGERKIVRFARDNEGGFHQFFTNVEGAYHWAGSTNGRDFKGKLVKEEIKVPNHIQKYLTLKQKGK